MMSMDTTQIHGGKNVNQKHAYRNSFGTLPDGTVYVDLLGINGEPGLDLRPTIAKAHNDEYRTIDEMTADGSTLREAMTEVAVQKDLTTSDWTLPVYPWEDLVNLTRARTPFWEMLPKITSETITVDQDSVTDLADAQVGGESTVPSPADDTVVSQTLPMTYWRVAGAVTGPMQLASQTLRNAMATEQQHKATAMRYFGENLSLNGNPTAGTTDGSINDERAFNGARTLAIDNGHTSDAAGAVITKQDVRENMRQAAEGPGGDMSSLVNITDLKTLTDLKNDFDNAYQYTIDTGSADTIEFGARYIEIDGQPVIVSDYMPTSPQGTANPTGRELLTVDMRFHSVRQLSGLVMEALGKTRDADDFFMKEYAVMVQAAGAHEYTHLAQGFE